MADNFKERFSQAVKETETVVYSYLPEETGHQKTIFEAMNYSVKCRWKALKTASHAGSVPSVRRKTVRRSSRSWRPWR